MTDLQGKTALVTGAARRLGRAACLALGRRGANVAVHYNRSAEAAEEVVHELEALGVRACPLQANLADPEAAASVLHSLPKGLPPLDILVNNASIFDEARFCNLGYEALDVNVRVNALAPVILARVLASQGRPGHVVNLLDCRIADYDKDHVPYHLSKRMLADLTRIMAVEFAPAIQVNAVAPGLILPPEGKDENYLESLVHTNPLNRYGGPEDIVDAVLFLLQSRFITGQTIYVDGGRNLRGSMYG